MVTRYNVKMLKRLKDQILSDPKSFSMGSWGGELENYEKSRPDAPFCGTVGCMCGWINALDWKDQGYLDLSNCDFGDISNAKRLLGWSKENCSLFFPQEWPEEYQKMYVTAEGPIERALVAAHLLDAMIEGKDLKWVAGEMDRVYSFEELIDKEPAFDVRD